MIVKLNDSFSKNAGKLKTSILNAGYGETERGWGDKVVNTPYSRFYIILEGEFYIITDKGERFDFKEGNAYLIPSGASYEFGCDSFMKHIYFHLQLCSFDKIDLLGEISAPLSVPFKSAYTKEELIRLARRVEYNDLPPKYQKILKGENDVTFCYF